MAGLDVVVSGVGDEGELKRFGELAVEVFRFPAERVGPYLENFGKENVRLGRVGGAMAGGLVMIPMGQFWGGKSVPMTGFAVVAVAAEHRSGGVGAEMMRGALRELYEKGCPLATLFPATFPLYRKVGFEVAGWMSDVRVKTAGIDCREAGVTVRAMVEGDREWVRGMYREAAGECSGNLNRSESLWNRVTMRGGVARKGYVLERGGKVEGYFYCSTEEEKPVVLWVADCVVTTAAAGRRFWQFVADHRSTVEKVGWLGSPQGQLLLMLREPAREVVGTPYWMLRIVRVAEALGMRGYGAAAKGELHLRIRDEVLGGNAGDYVLEVSGGRGEVRRGGRGSLEMDARGLAALYAGAVSGKELVRLGWASGEAEEVEMAAGIFAGPTAWMRDAF